MTGRRPDAGRPGGQDAARHLIDAWRAQDAAVLTRVLHRRVVLTTDGLGSTADHPVRGAPGVAAALLRMTPPEVRHEWELSEATGMPGIVLRRDGRVHGVIVVETRRGHITRLWGVFNPLKLTTWA